MGGRIYSQVSMNSEDVNSHAPVLLTYLVLFWLREVFVTEITYCAFKSFDDMKSFNCRKMCSVYFVLLHISLEVSSLTCTDFLHTFGCPKLYTSISFPWLICTIIIALYCGETRWSRGISNMFVHTVLDVSITFKKSGALAPFVSSKDQHNVTVRSWTRSLAFRFQPRLY